MIRAAALVLVFFGVVLTRVVVVGRPVDPGADATMALGFVLVVAYFAGRRASAWGLPSITGYILIGILFGPHALAGISPRLVVLSTDAITYLQLLDGAALGLIALTAGGELKLSILRRRRRSLLWIISLHVVLVTSGVALITIALRGQISGLMALPWSATWAAALMLGVTAVAKSPATTIAVIQEYQPRGAMTDVVLAVTVTKDVVVVTVFTVALVVAIPLVVPGSTFDVMTLFRLGWEVLGSLVIGVGIGWLLALYLKRVGIEMPLVVLAVAFISGGLTADAHLSGLLICMVAGFYVENYSDHGDDLIKAVERHSLPLYLIFFTIAGAALDLAALRQTWIVALALVLARALFTFVATFAGARIAGESPSVQRHAWTGFIGQAGVTLGFSGIITRRLPGIGGMLSTLIVAAVAVNQIVGPVLFRVGLYWAGDIRSPTQGREPSLVTVLPRRPDDADEGDAYQEDEPTSF